MSYLSISLLGSFEAKLGDTPLTGFSTDKVRALLAYLAVERSRPHRREALAGLLWPGYPERSARTSLRHALAKLRRVLGDPAAASPFLLVEGETIQLNPQADVWVDVTRFEDLVEKTERQDNLPSLHDAVSLYRGAFLEGFSLADSPEFEDWMRIERQSLQGAALGAYERLAGVYEGQGELRKACQMLRKTLILEPWREEAHRRLMHLLALDGQRSAALAQYALCQQSLKTELGVKPAEETRQLYEQIRKGTLIQTEMPVQPVGTPSVQDAELTRSHNLPRQLTSFIGREVEVDEIQSLLKENPLLTLVGVGGVGKTRAALQVAGRIVKDFSEGVWLADLAPVSDENLLLPTVAQALGMHIENGPQAEAVLLEYCQKRQLLLILDNCEHMAAACAYLSEKILSSCPQVKILAISREMLGIPGEAVYPLLPFSTPGADDSPEGLAQYEAVRLFVDRALKILPGFALDSHNAAAIGKVCTQLDGIPLAIELAAAWVRMLPVDQISTRLEESLDYLRGASRTALPRQQTMRGCLDWSYNLLEPDERSLLQALSVFNGGWTLEAAEIVGAVPSLSQKDILALLDQLVLKSLVQVRHDPETETRYRLLEPVRQYAGEKLAFEKLPDCGNHGSCPRPPPGILSRSGGAGCPAPAGPPPDRMAAAS